MFNSWIGLGYVLVGDLFVDDTFLTLDRLRHSMEGQSQTNVLFQYYALYNALPAAWRSVEGLEAINPEQPTFHGREITYITSNYTRDILLKMRQKPPCCVNFWSRKYNNIVVDRKIFMAPFSATKEVRLQVLQWKIIHNIYPTQILLNKMGKSTDSNCRYCGQRDFIEHFFCSCPSVVAIWMTVFHLFIAVISDHALHNKSQSTYIVQGKRSVKINT